MQSTGPTKIMVTTSTTDSQSGELCENCDAMTPHQVTIEIVTENEANSNAAFSREPYRVTECQQCGTTSKQRANNM
jgi:hypothetical protein